MSFYGSLSRLIDTPSVIEALLADTAEHHTRRRASVHTDHLSLPQQQPEMGPVISMI